VVPAEDQIMWGRIGSIALWCWSGRIGGHRRILIGWRENDGGTMRDQEIRGALDRHWRASDCGDFATEHDIYHEDAVLDYPQSRERILGRQNIQTTRTLQPNNKRFVVHRILGSGDLWITEYVLAYDGKPSYTVSIMEFRETKVAHETQYFGDPFEAAKWRKQWVVSMDSP
jgi:hypothetical protein